MPGAFLIAKGTAISQVGLQATDDGLLLVETFLHPGVARQLTATSSGQSQQLTPECRRINFYCRNSDCRYTIGTTDQASTVNADSSHYVVENERVSISIPAGSYIGYIRDSASQKNGIIELSELLP